ncbi:MAG TPA: hypothetical protein VMJ33_00530 [Gallionella sp.]|nr:hypothetical protein [Gallionella sp.]
MKNNISLALATGILGVTMAFAAQIARAGDQMFSLSSTFDNGTFDNGSDQYETGPWAFKLTDPSGIPGPARAVPKIGGFGDIGESNNSRFGLGETEAAASYNIYAGGASSPEVNLTGKVRVNMSGNSNVFSLTHNDYSAQMDVYQNLSKFTAKGTLGSKVQGSPTGIILSPVLYGSFGGIYQLTEQTSTGVDMSLSQDPAASGITQQEVSAYVNYKLDKNFKARGYVQRGYSNGNPNNILGGQVYYGF